MSGAYAAVLATTLLAASAETPLCELGDMLVGRWVGETEGTLGDRSKISARFVTVFREGGTKLIGECDFSIGGKKQEPVRDVYTKVDRNQRAHESSREDFREFCETWEGRWTGDVTWVADWPGLGKRGEKVTAYWEGRMAEDGNAMIGKFFGGTGSSTSLVYYDPGVKQIKWLWIESGGALLKRACTRTTVNGFNKAPQLAPMVPNPNTSAPSQSPIMGTRILGRVVVRWMARELMTSMTFGDE